MQKTVYIIIGCLLSFSASITNASTAFSMQVGNDTILKHLFPFVEVGNAGAGVIWDFRQLNNPVSEYRIITLCPYLGQTDVACIREPHMRSFWESLGDSLYCTGYETSNVKMDFPHPELRLKRSMVLGDTLRSDFAGNGEYGHHVPVLVQGQTIATLDAEGTILLGNDTLRNVVRMHTIRRYALLNGDSTNVEIQRWQWFMESHALPVVDIMRSTRTHKTNVALDTTIYAATWVNLPPGSRGEPTAKKSAYKKNPDQDSVLVQVKCVPNPVQDNLHISYCLSQESEVTAELYSSIGARIYNIPLQKQPAGYYKHVVPMTDFMAGTYVLYLKAGEVELKKIIIKR